ncbi:MAG: AbrB/MazE/SpoVT family DNA-binding domain-containing protein [Mobilicoccus sp.]|nr:AbrB/MazE/SpoVT family DNA-binding domain-containing protein [Mobilicoccus sp.]
MITTIDAAGRIVVPKALRDALGLGAGRRIDVVLHDGKLEIDVAPAAVMVTDRDGLPVLQARDQMPPLMDEDVRGALDSVRR